MSAGVLPDSAIDTLLMYAYLHKGVVANGVTIEIDRDEAGNGARPSVRYKIKIDTLSALKWKAIKKADQIQNPVLKKAALLALAKAGAPVGLEEQVQAMASAYLPKHYRVEVQVVV